jgi:hypothetical protein
MTSYPIPKGWRRVTRGKTRTGDKAWDMSRLRFESLSGFLVGYQATLFVCIIRRVTAKENASGEGREV